MAKLRLHTLACPRLERFADGENRRGQNRLIGLWSRPWLELLLESGPKNKIILAIFIFVPRVLSSYGSSSPGLFNFGWIRVGLFLTWLSSNEVIFILLPR